jgi:hypothetical protein
MSNLNQSKLVSSYTASILNQHCSLWVKCKSFFICVLVILNSCSGSGPGSVYPSSEALSESPQVVFRNNSTGDIMVLQADEQLCFDVNRYTPYSEYYFMCGQAVRFGHGIKHPLDHTHSIEALSYFNDLHRIQFVHCDFSIESDKASDQDFTTQLFGGNENYSVVSLQPLVFSDEATIDSIYYSIQHGLLRIFHKNGTIWDRAL